MDDAARERALRASCDRHLCWHGHRDPAVMLADLPDVIEPDRYGDGGVVTELEEVVATLLGKPAAVFMPTGTTAQQIALRIHADDRGRRTVLAHPAAHPNRHEGQTLQRLHDLTLRPVGDGIELLTLADLQAVAEPAAALLIELPQRDLGGPLPTWEALTAQTAWARARGMAVHLDGARLWESLPYFDRPAKDVASLFDSVYVSFYKGLGAIAGACLAGQQDLIDRAREWRHRHGGTAFALWPYAAHALASLRMRLPRMPAYRDHAVAIAEALRDVPGVEVTFDPPQTPMLHLSLRTTATAFRTRAVQLALDDGVWTWSRSWPTDRPTWRRVELAVGDATLTIAPDQVAQIIRRLVDPLPRHPAGVPGQDLVEVLDEHGAVTAVVSRSRMRAEGLRHRCTYVVVMTGDDEVVVHQRAPWKDVNASAWDLAFGGVCDVGEPWADAAARELAEEAGLHDAVLTDLGEASWAGDGAQLTARVYLTRHDGPLDSPDGEAVAFDTVPVDDLPAWMAAHDVCEDSAAIVPDLLHRHLSVH